MENSKKRNLLGLVGWFFAGLVINIIAFVPMVLREKKQSKEGGFPLEWDDIIRYGAAIIIGAELQGLIIQGFV